MGGGWRWLTFEMRFLVMGSEGLIAVAVVCDGFEETKMMDGKLKRVRNLRRWIFSKMVYRLAVVVFRNFGSQAFRF